jgi:hypothetical protein
MHENEERCGQKVFGVTLTMPFQFTTGMEWILEGMMGGSPTGTSPKSYPYSSTLPSYTIELSKGSRIKTYKGCKINSVTIAGSGNEPVDVTVEYMALDLSTGGSQTTVSGSSPIIGVFSDSTINDPQSGTSQAAESFEMIYSNNLTAVFGTDRVACHHRPGSITTSLAYTQRDQANYATIIANYLAHTKDSVKLTITFDSKTATFDYRSVQHVAGLPGYSGGEPGDGETEAMGMYDGTNEMPIIQMTDIT